MDETLEQTSGNRGPGESKEEDTEEPRKFTGHDTNITQRNQWPGKVNINSNEDLTRSE